MAEIMPLVGGRIWKCYYAGKAKNRPLAAFQLKEAVNLLEKGAILRPKYEDDVEEFVVRHDGHDQEGDRRRGLGHLRGGVRGDDRPANAYHEKYDKGFLRWKMPEEPPPDLDLTAT